MAAVYYFYKKRGGKNWRVSKKEVKEVKDAVSSGFEKIKKDIKKRQEPKQILKDISKVEKKIEDEMKDIK